MAPRLILSVICSITCNKKQTSVQTQYRRHGPCLHIYCFPPGTAGVLRINLKRESPSVASDSDDSRAVQWLEPTTHSKWPLYSDWDWLASYQRCLSISSDWSEQRWVNTWTQLLEVVTKVLLSCWKIWFHWCKVLQKKIVIKNVIIVLLFCVLSKPLTCVFGINRGSRRGLLLCWDLI